MLLITGNELYAILPLTVDLLDQAVCKLGRAFQTFDYKVHDKTIRFYSEGRMERGMWPETWGKVDMVGRELRGVAVDLSTGTVVARPYRKFWGPMQHANAQNS